MTDYVIGAGNRGGGGGKGGNGGGARTASVDPDSLQSKQHALVLDLISEGEIEGFPSARAYARDSAQYNRALLKDIFLNNTPIAREGANPANAYQVADLNFRDFEVFNRYGTQNQTQMLFSTATQEEVNVSTQVTNAIPITRTVTDVNVDGVRITLSTPALQIFRRNGDVVGTRIDFRIQFSYGGGPFTTVKTDSIVGRTADLYTRSYILNFAAPPPVSIRVIRDTSDNANDSSGDPVQNSLFWTSYTERIYEKLRYPNSALVGFRFNAEQFSNIPERMYRVRGIKVRIPDNATVDSTNGRLTYAGIWSGNFQVAKWTTDPAWILWDLLTNSRYGTGAYVSASQLDKYAFFAASQYSSALVPNGFGGTEPRFSCNVCIQTQEEVFKLINDMCSVFRAMPFWSVGSLTVAQDRPTDATYIFNQSNVTEEGFTYSGSSLKTRSTVVAVKYFDMTARTYTYEVVEDATAIAKFGINKKEVDAFACTSKGQARRVGEWILYEENNTTEVVSFKTGIAPGQYVRPGEVIKVMDPVRAGFVRGGRVVSVSGARQITIDRQASTMFTDTVPSTFTFQVVLQDQTVQVINGATINGNLVTLPTDLLSQPYAGSPWMITIPTLSGQPFRVLTVQEESDGITYAITGIKYDFSKYDYVERDIPLTPTDISDLNVAPATPAQLSASEVLYESSGQVLAKLIISWRAQTGVARYILRYKLGDGNWTTVATQSPDFEVLNSAVGLYRFELQAESAGFTRSGIATAQYNALGRTAPPATIPDLFITPIDAQSAELSWPQAVDLDVRIGGQIRIRHTTQTGANAVWGNSNDIVPASPGSATRKIVPLLAGTYFIRAVDSSNNESTGVASVVVSLPAPQDALLVQSYREDTTSPPFRGTTTTMVYNADEAGLIAISTGLIDTIPDWDALADIDFYGATVSAADYVFYNALDLGATYDINLRSVLQTRAFEPNNRWDDRTRLVDAWNDIDGNDLGATNGSLSVRTTTDNPAGTPTYSTWQPFVNGIARGRGFQFRFNATINNPAQNIAVQQLGVITELQRRTETQRNLTSGAAAYTVTFPAAFYATPSIGITAQDMNQGDYFTLSNASRTGFTVTFRNSGGSMVSRNFDYQAVGHGRQIT